MYKRFWITCMALIIVLAMGSQAMAAGVTPRSLGQFPIVDEPVTIKVFAPVEPFITDLVDNVTTKKWQEHTNVVVEWITSSSGTAATERINLMLAANNDLPEVMFYNFSNQQLIAYGSQGIFLPLNTMIDEYGFYLKNQMMNDIPFTKNVLTAPDGNIYAMPNFNGCFHCTLSQKAWINQNWLDNLNLAMPTTPDELYTVLKAFKESDANGNGDPNDEIPMIGTNGWHGYVEGFLMNPFALSTGRATPRLLIENGVVTSSAVTMNFKEGLKYIAKMYSEGLIDAEAFSMTTDQAMMLTGDPNGNRVGLFPAGHSGVCVNLASDVKDEFEILAPLKGADGIARTPVWESYPAPRAVITNTCQNPEVAFVWLDAMLDGSLESMMTYWRPEPAFRLANEGEIGLDGNPATNGMGKGPKGESFAWGVESNYWWAGLNIEYNTNTFRNGIAVEPDVWNLEKVLYDASVVYQPYGAQTLPPLFQTEEVLTEINELATLIRTYMDESIANFCTGASDIDAEWDGYVAELDAMGLQRYLELVQTAYTEQYGN